MPDPMLTRSRLAVSSSALPGDPRLAARAASAAGFSGILFDLASKAFDILQLSVSGRREFAHMLTAQNLRLVGVRTDAGIKGFSPGADIDRALARIDAAIEACAALGAGAMPPPILCLELGPLPAPAPIDKPRPKITPDMAGLILLPNVPEPARNEDAPAAPPDPALISCVDAALAELGRKADRYGVILAMRSDLAGFAALHRALAAAGCAWFGVDLDPVAILGDDWPIDEIFSRLGALVRHVRGRDAVAGADRRSRPATVGQGSTRWDRVLNFLDESAYRGFITLDPVELPDRPAAALAGADFLRRVGSES